MHGRVSIVEAGVLKRKSYVLMCDIPFLSVVDWVGLNQKSSSPKAKSAISRPHHSAPAASMAGNNKKRRRAEPTGDVLPFKNKLKPDSVILQILKEFKESCSSSSSTKTLTLKNYLSLSSVQENIESPFLRIEHSILDFPFANISTDRRSAITARVIQLIYLLYFEGFHVTDRDLFYTEVKLLHDQLQSDTVLDDVSCTLGCTRSSLNVVAGEMGVVFGRLNFSDNGDMIDCTKMGTGGKVIPPNIDRVRNMQSDALFILLVQKDAAYIRLDENRFYNRFPCIIVIAKGQPHVSTRLFLRKMKTELKLPVLALVDSDPYGLKILSVYGCGSKNMSDGSAHLAIPDIKWLGVRPSDLDKYKIPEHCRLPMTEQDIKTVKDMLEEDFVKKNPGWVEELTLMVKTKQKAEIEALSAFDFQYLTEVYLPLKLQQQDWL